MTSNLFSSNSGSESFKDQIQKQALEATLKALQEKVATLTCPIHHQNPKLKTSEGGGPGKQNMFFDCCCDTLKKMMEETLKS
jgi:hypothetical protein